jgi:hypothetical protein
MDRSKVREIAGTDILGGLGHLFQGAVIAPIGAIITPLEGGFFLNYGIEELQISGFWMGLNDYPHLITIYRNENGMPIIATIHSCDVPSCQGYLYPAPDYTSENIHKESSFIQKIIEYGRKAVGGMEKSG